MDLEKILKVNQLIVEFDNSLERATDEVHEFWENLVSQRDTTKLFTKGI